MTSYRDKDTKMQCETKDLEQFKACFGSQGRPLKVKLKQFLKALTVTWKLDE